MRPVIWFHLKKLKLFFSKSFCLIGVNIFGKKNLNVFTKNLFFIFFCLAGFKLSLKNVPETPTKFNKQEKQLRERLDDFINMRNSSPSDFKLPPLSPRLRVPTPNTNRKKSSQTIDSSLNIVFSITNGIKYALTSELEKMYPELSTATNKKVDRKQSNSQFSIATHSHRS